MDQQLIVERRQKVLRVQINRPEKRNALTTDIYRQLTTTLAVAEQDSAIRVVYLTGCERSFSRGNDIADFLKMADSQDEGADYPGLQFLQQLSTFNKPLVAAVSGVAIGIGTTLLLHCDLVYAAEQTRFHLPFVDLGLVPEGGSSLLLPAMLLMLAEPFDADRAVDIGLVNRVCRSDELQAFAWHQAVKLAAKPAEALVETKRLLQAGYQQALAQTLITEIETCGQQLKSPEVIKALSQFWMLLQPKNRVPF